MDHCYNLKGFLLQSLSFVFLTLGHALFDHKFNESLLWRGLIYEINLSTCFDEFNLFWADVLAIHNYEIRGDESQEARCRTVDVTPFAP